MAAPPAVSSALPPLLSLLSPGRQAHWSLCRRRAASTPSARLRLQPEPSWFARGSVSASKRRNLTLFLSPSAVHSFATHSPHMATSCTASRQCRLPRKPTAASPAPRRRCTARAGMRQAGHHADCVATADVLASDGTVGLCVCGMFCGLRKPVETKNSPSLFPTSVLCCARHRPAHPRRPPAPAPPRAGQHADLHRV